MRDINGDFLIQLREVDASVENRTWAQIGLYTGTWYTKGDYDHCIREFRVHKKEWYEKEKKEMMED